MLGATSGWVRVGSRGDRRAGGGMKPGIPAEILSVATEQTEETTHEAVPRGLAAIEHTKGP